MLFSLLSLASLSSAHFLLNSPPSIGFDDDNEGIAPCGGFTPDFSNASSIVDFHVGGEALAMTFTHTTGNWLFRATTDQSAQSGWVQLFPIVQQNGLGNFCEPQVTVPASYAGKQGVVGVVVDAPDGMLYQCIAANFVSGTASPPSQCKNSTSATFAFSTDSELTALVGPGSSSNNTSNSTSSGSSSSSSPSSTSTGATASPSSKGAAVSLQQAGISFGLSVALIGGAALML